MSADQTHWYASKIDWWVIPLLCVSPLTAVAVCVAFTLSGSMFGLAVGVATAVLVAAIYLGLLIPIRYGLDDSYLVVRFGICRVRIVLADISDVHTTRSPLSAPALSLDRLHVQYGRGFLKQIMISPTDRDLFLDELAQKAGLKREGERLFRI